MSILLALSVAAVAASAIPKIRPLTPAAYAAQCKASAQVMQESLGLPPSQEWRELHRDRVFWEERHRRAQPDAALRARQDADALAGRYDISMRDGVRRGREELAASRIASCRRIREAAQ